MIHLLARFIRQQRGTANIMGSSRRRIALSLSIRREREN